MSTCPEENVVIRAFGTEDLETVVEIDRQSTGQDRRAWLARYAPGPRNDSRISLSFVAEKDGVVVGFVLGGVYHGEFGAVEPLAILEGVGISDTERRQGIGHLLFASFAGHAKRLGVKQVRTLVAWNEGPLLAFFASMAMRPTGLIPLAVPVDAVPVVPRDDL